MATKLITLFVSLDWVDQIDTEESWNHSLLETLELALEAGAKLDSVERLEPYGSNAAESSYLIKIQVKGERRAKQLMELLAGTMGPGSIQEIDPRIA